MFELTANARNGPGTRVSAPRVDSRQISWWAEAADGTRDKELALVLTASGEYVVKEEEPGDFVILTMYTPSEAPKRRKPVEITLQAPGCEKMRIDEIADALFWTESAVEKFVYPYYAFQRLLTDEEMMRLKAEFRDERAVALWHQAPSRTVIVYGKGSGIEAPGLAVGSDQPPRGSATMDVPLLARHSTPRVDSRQISWWAESADGTRDKELALVLTASGEYVVKVEEPGDDVVLRMYTPSARPNRLRPTEITFQAPGCERIRIDELADALFWTESAVEKFLFPYYAAQRLLSAAEMRQLKKGFRNERVVAIWHKAPSNYALLYGEESGLDTLNVLAADPESSEEMGASSQSAREFLAVAGR